MPDASDAELLGAVTAHYAVGLAHSPAALSWFEGRGVDAGLVAAFGLGYADRSLGLVLPERNRKAGAVLRGRLQSFGVLRAASGHEHLRGCVTVPVRDTNGTVTQVAGFRVGRARDERGVPAALSLPGLPAAVFNPAALNCSEVIVADTVLDALVNRPGFDGDFSGWCSHAALA